MSSLANIVTSSRRCDSGQMNLDGSCVVSVVGIRMPVVPAAIEHFTDVALTWGPLRGKGSRKPSALRM